VDKLENAALADMFLASHPNAVLISAERGDGLAALLAQLGALLRPVREFVELRVPGAHPASPDAGVRGVHCYDRKRKTRQESRLGSSCNCVALVGSHRYQSRVPGRS
jgi:50S ribosomal subunit-associated GTPase HflX